MKTSFRAASSASSYIVLFFNYKIRTWATFLLLMYIYAGYVHKQCNAKDFRRMIAHFERNEKNLMIETNARKSV